MFVVLAVHAVELEVPQQLYVIVWLVPDTMKGTLL